MEPSTIDTLNGQLATEVPRIRSLLQNRSFIEALSATQALRVTSPENRDLLYLAAVALRHLNRIPEALSTLQELERLHPRYGRLFQERGHCYVVTRSAPEAIEAFTHATALNSALPASWRALERLFKIVGRPDDAQRAGQFSQSLAALPPEVLTAHSMFADGETQDAERMVRKYLLEHGDHVEAMRLLAQIGMKLDVADDAEILLENVLALAPEYHAARYDYALALLKRHKHLRAREEMEKLLAVDPDNRVYRTTHATVCIGFGDVAQALPLYRELLATGPADAELHLSIGHALKTLGQVNKAIDSYRSAAAERPNFGDAYWSLANLKTYRFLDSEVDRMRLEEAEPRTALADRYHLCFALGKALEDRGQFEESFSYYERGNALKKSECRYRPEHLENLARLQIELCTQEFFEIRKGFGCQDRGPIFIVGLPRAGSTLIEQILASHSQVEGTMELADIPRLVGDLRDRLENEKDPRYPRILSQLTHSDFAAMGRKYLHDTRAYRIGKPFFIDKMPNNFRHLALIQLILPNAKIIDARREPMACCFGNFKQLFASGQQFTYSFEDIAHYYGLYERLMEHWSNALPGKILQIQHEQLVDDLEGHVRKILDYCELEFEPGCVEFYKTQRRVHTASSEQVRRPITREGLDSWKNFERWLGPLRTELSRYSVDRQVMAGPT